MRVSSQRFRSLELLLKLTVLEYTTNDREPQQVRIVAIVPRRSDDNDVRCDRCNSCDYLHCVCKEFSAA